LSAEEREAHLVLSAALRWERKHTPARSAEKRIWRSAEGDSAVVSVGYVFLLEKGKERDFAFYRKRNGLRRGRIACSHYLPKETTRRGRREGSQPEEEKNRLPERLGKGKNLPSSGKGEEKANISLVARQSKVKATSINLSQKRGVLIFTAIGKGHEA